MIVNTESLLEIYIIVYRHMIQTTGGTEKQGNTSIGSNPCAVIPYNILWAAVEGGFEGFLFIKNHHK